MTKMPLMKAALEKTPAIQMRFPLRHSTAIATRIAVCEKTMYVILIIKIQTLSFLQGTNPMTTPTIRPHG